MTNAKHDEILEEQQFRGGNQRYNFAYAAEEGRVYKVGALDAQHGTMNSRRDRAPRCRSRVSDVHHLSARTRELAARPRLDARARVSFHVVPDSVDDLTLQFDSARDNHLREAPPELMAAPKNPEDMRFGDLRRFIGALERSGGNADELKVELAQKIAVPVTCIIIALFGAPLATSTQRGGAAYGIAISLATTVLFLMMIQLTKAVGAKGLIPPYLAAWIPNVIFTIAGVYLLARVRT